MEIIYICTGNSFRSPIAEALTKKYHPQIPTKSAGIKPAPKISKKAKKLLKKDNSKEKIKKKPEKVKKSILKRYNKIIVMEKSHKEHLIRKFDLGKEKIHNWKIKDPIKPDVSSEKSYREIKNKVKILTP